ncbi:MAG TPA: thiamine phosphate synthase [Candidatus Acidoferrum sp.]|nr:thiamine phosphate synthase [Candidatus Acidoferrum sp.]
MRLVLPRLYVILDAALITHSERDRAEALAGAGVRLIQYRNKTASTKEYLRNSSELAELLRASGATLVVNDRADIAVLAGAYGVHVGQDDLEVESARNLVGPAMWVGISTHNETQFAQAAATSADYVAVGPVFPTASKANPDPVVGLDLIRKARALSSKPIVAIGGITPERAAEVIEAGADSVAVISGIWKAENPAKRAQEYLNILADARRTAAN